MYMYMYVYIYIYIYSACWAPFFRPGVTACSALFREFRDAVFEDVGFENDS